MELRWRALRESLAEQGADAATLDAMEAAVGGHDEVAGAYGQLLVGSGGRLRHDVVLPGPPRRESARWAPLPHLMPMVAQLAPVVPYVLALVDRTGADLTVHGPAGQWSLEVEGDDYPIRKVGVGGWSHLRTSTGPRTSGRPTPARSPTRSRPPCAAPRPRSSS